MNQQAAPLEENLRKEKTERDALAKVVEEVALDASRDPQSYLRETIVPEGGE